MAVRGGQEEIAMAIKQTARGRGCANTEGSMSMAVDMMQISTAKMTKMFFCLLISSNPKSLSVLLSVLWLVSSSFFCSLSLLHRNFPFSITNCFFCLSFSRDCSVPNLSTTRPIQKSLSRQDSQYSEDMDNLMNTKLVSGSTPPSEVHPNPVSNHTVAPGFGSALHLANSGTHGSLVTLDSYGSIAHQRANSVIRLPHPDYTAVDMPIFPSTNAILQGKDRINVCCLFNCFLE